MWPQRFPKNTPRHVDAWIRQLQTQIKQANLDYNVWSGGELRLSEDAIAWMGEHGVTKLAGSRCVLTKPLRGIMARLDQ